MVMKQYVKGNVTPAAANSVKYFIKMLAQSSETVIFIRDVNKRSGELLSFQNSHRKSQELRTTYINKAFDKEMPKDHHMTVTPQTGSHTNIRQLTGDTLQVNDPYQRGGRRQSTGGMKDQRKSFNWTDNHNV
ncbi:hypothetical protein OESDEN_06208 [Oesophagostomum dentatum]|uniref:Uncharacterized protein n=1 Tax=Oesophagostomum dentatum TaxID=61180 RepID=A0A0B1T9E8_OESDE|nr:hypothetical protein OESDEN_06208 [Oesophagostomum dentatum]